MDLGFSEPQEMLRKMARDFLEKECPKTLVRELQESEPGHSPDLWRQMAELGWQGLPFPEKYGGGECDLIDLTLLLEEMGRAVLPSPFVSTVVLCGLAILEAGTEEQKQQFLPQIAKGEMILALAWTEQSAGYDAASIQVGATPSQDGYLISGVKLFVQDAHIADYLLVAARTSQGSGPEEGITLFLVDAKSPGISCTPLNTIGWDRQNEVVFDKVLVPKANILGKPEQGWAQVSRIMKLGVLAQCALMVGEAQQALEMSVEYAKQRIQFGRPIGAFQAIQHRCADMVTDVDASRVMTYYAAWKLSQGGSCALDISHAKAWVSEACNRVLGGAHQIGGGIACTTDSDMHLFSQRVAAQALLFGDTNFHRKLVAEELEL